MSEIEEIKARLDIVEVIGQHVRLQRAGRNYKALCPFHTERTPSFIVSPERQSWHCFGACGTGGDVISFVMRKEGLDFRGAVRMLAERAGVPLRERPDRQEEEQWRRLREANEAAALWYHHLLLNSDLGRPARQYIERRGIDAGMAEAFLLGYSPPAWEAAREYLCGRGFTDPELLAAGLLVEGESGPHDRFRGRLMFPIRDPRGRVIGFGARALDDSLPKYLNTSQTAIFDKGSTLYGLDRAAEAIRREGRGVIVEGYMDVIAAHQHGFQNVVATMGTALTEAQIRLLKRHARRVVVALDADVAGSEATLRALSLHLETGSRADPYNPSPDTASPEEFQRDVFRIQRGIVAGNVEVDVEVAALPPGKDPDDLIRESPESWRGALAGARPLMDFWFQAAASRRDLSSPRERSELARELLPVVGIVRDPVVRAHYLQRLSRLALVSERELGAMMTAQTRRSRPPWEATQADQRGGPAVDPREAFLLALLLRYPSLREEGLDLPLELLWGSESRQVLEAWRRVEGNANSLNEALPEELIPFLERLVNWRVPQYDEREAREALLDCRRRLEQRQLEAEKQATAALLAAQEEEWGASLLASLAVSATEVSDERAREAVEIHLRDMEMGKRLHRLRLKGKGRMSEGSTCLPADEGDSRWLRS